MKNLTRLTIASLSIFSLLITNNVKAQTTQASPWRFGIGAEVGAPTGNLSNIMGVEAGGTARLQYGVSNRFDIILTSGYYNYFSGSNSNTATIIGNYTYATKTHDLGIIPVKLGFKAFFASNVYVSAEAGVGFETSYNEDKKLILAPGLGWTTGPWDASLRYENFSGQGNNYGLVGLRVAYGFGL